MSLLRIKLSKPKQRTNENKKKERHRNKEAKTEKLRWNKKET